MQISLRPKQEAFVQAYIECKNATEAYAKVYGREGSNRSTFRGAGYRTLKSPAVQARIAELQSKTCYKTVTTIESLVAEQEKAMTMAEQAGNSAAYAAASMNKAKLLGLLVERQAVMTATVPIEQLSPDLNKIWHRAVGQNVGRALPGPANDPVQSSTYIDAAAEEESAKE